jgi:hypothetical protein
MENKTLFRHLIYLYFCLLLHLCRPIIPIHVYVSTGRELGESFCRFVPFAILPMQPGKTTRLTCEISPHSLTELGFDLSVSVDGANPMQGYEQVRRRERGWLLPGTYVVHKPET